MGSRSDARHGLHQRILDFIPTHHGTSLVEYFYHKAITQRGADDVTEEEFRYSGPKPFSKETGIVNLADATEASTRSLDAPSPASIRTMVHKIIMKRMMDRQLDDTGLTFQDLSRIEDAFVRVLVGIFHVRPKYPDDPGQSIAGRACDGTRTLRVSVDPDHPATPRAGAYRRGGCRGRSRARCSRGRGGSSAGRGLRAR